MSSLSSAGFHAEHEASRGTWILIQSETQVQLLSALAFPAGSVGEGEFTLAVDRSKLTPVLEQVLMRRLRLYLKSQDWVGYRVLLNMQDVHLRGLSAKPVYEFIPGFESWDEAGSTEQVAQFLYQNGFDTVKDVDKAGWTPLHCAALRGDISLIQHLLERGADVNLRTNQARVDAGLPGGLSCLDLCMLFKQNGAARLLLTAKAGLADGYQPSILPAAHTNNSEAVRLLCEFGSKVTVRHQLLFSKLCFLGGLFQRM